MMSAIGRLRCWAAAHRGELYFAGATLGMGLIVLSPVMQSGFTGDDGHDSMVRGLLRLKQQNVFAFTFSYMWSWIRNEGRLYPLAWFGYTLFSVLTDVRVYKLSKVMFVLLNTAFFGFFVKRLTKSTGAALLSLAATPLFFQLHDVVDPMVSYHWMFPVMFLYIVGSLLLFLDNLEQGGRGRLTLSLILYGMSLLTYEITYPFWLLHAAVAWLSKRDVREAARRTVPFFLLAVTCAAASFALRWLARAHISPAYVPRFEVGTYLVTVAKQASAAFPMSYVLFDPHRIFGGAEVFFRAHLSATHLLVFAGTFLLLVEALRRVRAEVATGARTGSNGALLLGALLWVIPGVLVALSPRYQEWAGWGFGHLNVYFAYFGAVLFLVGTVEKVLLCVGQKPMLVTTLSLAVSMAGASSAVITYNANQMVVERINHSCLHPRTIIEGAMRRRLFRDVPAGAGLIVEKNNTWDQRAFYQLHAGKEFRFVGKPGAYLAEASRPGGGLHQFSADDRIYYLNYSALADSVGYAILAPADRLSVDETNVYGARGDRVIIYVRFPFFAPVKVALIGRQAEKRAPDTYRSFVRSEVAMREIVSRPNEKIFELDEPNGWFDLRSLRLQIGTEDGGESWFPRLTSERHLPLDGDLAHGGFSGRIGAAGLAMGPIELGSDFSLELLVKPDRGGLPLACVIGNHPGFDYFQGFVLQQDNNIEGRYLFAFGNGKVWLPGARFDLSPDRWHHLVISVAGGRIAVYRNGEAAGSAEAGDSIRNSRMPVWIGNWINGNRPFAGNINEFRVVNRALSKTEAVRDWNLVRNHLKSFGRGD